jgi:hypothetical protein
VKIAIRQCKHSLKKNKNKKRKKRKGKDDRTLIRSNLTYLNLIFCGPEWTEEKIAITGELWIHPSTLVHAEYIIKYGPTPKGGGSLWEWANPQ